MAYYGHMMEYGMGYGYFGIFWNLILLAAFVWLVVWLINKNKTRTSPTDILKSRYAKGEITKKQFEEMKKDIK